MPRAAPCTYRGRECRPAARRKTGARPCFMPPRSYIGRASDGPQPSVRRIALALSSMRAFRTCQLHRTERCQATVPAIESAASIARFRPEQDPSARSGSHRSTAKGFSSPSGRNGWSANGLWRVPVAGHFTLDIPGEGILRRVALHLLIPRWKGQLAAGHVRELLAIELQTFRTSRLAVT